MNKGINHFLRSVLTMLVMGLLCLPCTVKREFKQQLGIPVPGNHSPVKTNAVTSCNYAVPDGKSRETPVATRARYGKAGITRDEKLPFSYDAAGTRVSYSYHPAADIPVFLKNRQLLI